jgi:hypothetical protein
MGVMPTDRKTIENGKQLFIRSEFNFRKFDAFYPNLKAMA